MTSLTRVTSVSSHREPVGDDVMLRPSFIANDVVHPPHMAEPGEDGYRTPTGEDFEHYFQLRRRLGDDRAPLRQGGVGRHERFGAIDDVAKGEGKGNGGNSLSSSSSSSSSTSQPSSAATAAAGASEAHRSHMERVKLALEHGEHRIALGLRQRMKHYTWSFFTITMATGGIANVLWHVPFRFNGIYTIGCIFFLLNVVLFFVNVICISLRFYLHPKTLRNSFLHPTESLFAPAAIVSFGTILVNISQYGTNHVGDWLNTVVMVLFWVYLGLAFVASFGIYLLFWSTQSFTIASMTPVWIFPAYPLLIVGPFGAVLSGTLSPDRSAQILVGAFTAQGIGLLVSLMIYSAYIYRLMTQKLPLERLRPGMFVSVGPSAFTASGLSNMGQHAQRTWAGTDFMGNGDLAAMILKVVGDWTALWFWGLSLWFFAVALGAHYSCCVRRRSMAFAMTWFSFVFPQTALVTSTFAVAGAFQLRPLQIVACVMTVLLIAVWLFVVFMMVRAILLKQILWPQKGEDKNEGGFKGTPTAQSPGEDPTGEQGNGGSGGGGGSGCGSGEART